MKVTQSFIILLLTFQFSSFLSPEFQPLYIESKRYLPLTEKNIIQLYFGLFGKTQIRSKAVNFEIDFEHSDIILSSETQCESNNYCEYQSYEKYNFIFHGFKLEYYKVTIFLGLANVKPHEITLENIEKVPKIEAKLIVNPFFTKNVIGMNPNSASYLYFNKLYQFKENTLRIKLFNHDNYKYLLISNLIYEYHKVFEEQTPKKDIYEINTWIKTIDTLNRMKHYSAKTCIRNKNPALVFKLEKEYYLDLLASICLNPDTCKQCTDLDEKYTQVKFIISYGDQNEAGKHYEVIVTGNDLVEINEDGTINLLFEELPKDELRCQIELEHLFFKNIFLLLKVDLENEKVMIGLDHANPQFFFLITPFCFWAHVFVLACYVIVLFYILFSKKTVRKRATALSYKNMSFTESFKPTN